MPSGSSTNRTSKKKQVQGTGKHNAIVIIDDNAPEPVSLRFVNSPNLNKQDLMDDVIDISSDEDEPPRKKSKTSDLKTRIEELEKDPMHLEDNVNCELCLLKMWYPFVLPDCGHVFCRKCIQDWFAATQKSHQERHPRHHHDQPVLVPQLIQEVIATNPVIEPQHLTKVLRRLDSLFKEPKYKCPMCRERVRQKPVEVFVMKSIVETMAAVQGQDRLSNTGEGARAGNIAEPNDPWDRFFPYRTEGRRGGWHNGT
ncbi:hypothetical protein EDD18DRAFT_1346511 [Armillaria luteobubalina]|uniref:RING-type domain-containing protein n=1 Tax=Armillaria luteobubalina TaxID=153913 RepID=A0AA39QFF9_9AGAR|nr:hypothetical protein EDD18DRAFT_1346511 [Armillaria luteobubalina]